MVCSRRYRRVPLLLGAVLLLAAPALLRAQAEPPAPAAGAVDHVDPVTPVLFGLVLIMVGAKLGGTVFLRLRQPAVLGELVCGVVLGNLLLLLPQTSPGAPEAWYAAFVRSALTHGSPVDILARLGVVLLLFQVGLESDLQAMMRVGATSFVVATIGVVCPFVLGFSVSYLLLPGGPHDPLVHVFVGACLTATSVGITARVLQELGRVDQDESRIVLGAAVIDDVMGLVILAVVSGMVNAKSTGAALSPLAVFRILAFSVGFLFGAVAIGRWLAPRVFMLASRLHGKGLLLITALVICFVLAGCANLIGLAPIVGAFAAGILLDEVHYEELRERHQEHDLELLLRPLTDFLVPVFFVQMGMTVKLSAFGQAGVIGFALLLTLVAIVGKQACGLVVPRRLDRLSVGVGMIPRGEVGLIFAGIGNGLRLGGERVINDVSNAAVVIMVIVTTMVTPPILQWTLARGDRRRARQTLET